MKKIVSVWGVLALSFLGGQEISASPKPWEHKEAPWEREEQQNSPEELSPQDEGTPASDHAFEGQGEPE